MRETIPGVSFGPSQSYRPPPPPPPPRRLPNSIIQPPSYVQWGLLPAVGSRDHYPLVRASCVYKLVDIYQAAELQHTFISTASRPANVTYIFPLPPDASVHAFRAQIDERVVEGVVMEKDKARETFDTAVANHQQAALLQQENIEIFNIMLGNVSPGQTVVVSISFHSMIALEGQGTLDTLRLTFPTTIAPRYGTPPTEINRFSLPATLPGNASTLHFELSVELGAPIKSITSTSHPISSALGRSSPEDGPNDGFDAQKAFISLSSETFLDKDVVIVLQCNGLDKPRCVVETVRKEDGSGDETDAYALTFVPRFALPTLPQQEYIFLIDRSGSMEGGKLRLLRSSLQIILRSLPSAGTTFNLISFGSRMSSLWPTSAPYTSDTLADAAAHVDSMSANYGGTKMREALEAAFGARALAAAGVPASIFVLTDGQCYDLDGVQGAIRAAVAGARTDGHGFLRVFCMGIGDAVSKGMCNIIARAGGGGAVFVGESERPDAKLVSLVRAAAGPPVDDLRVDWGLGTAEGSDENDPSFGSASVVRDAPSVAAWSSAMGAGATLTMFDEDHRPSPVPAQPSAVPRQVPTVRVAPPADALPALLPGFRFTHHAVVIRKRGASIPRSQLVHVTGSVLGHPITLQVPVSALTPTTHGSALQNTHLLHLVGAGALVQALEDAVPVRPHVQAKIACLGLEFGLATSQTSFVAVFEDGKRRAVEIASGRDESTLSAATGPLNMVAYGSAAAASLSTPLNGVARRKSVNRDRALPSPMLFGGTVQPQAGPLSVGLNVSKNRQPAFAAPPPAPAARRTNIEGLRFSSISNPDAAPLSPAPPAPPPPSAVLPRASMQGQYHMYSRAEGSRGRRLVQAGPRGALSGRVACVDRPTREGDGGALDNMPVQADVEGLARAQAFDGSFTSNAPLAQLLVGGPALPALPPALAITSVDAAQKAVVWCTLLAVAFLEVRFADEEAAWIVLREKAMACVNGALATAGVVDMDELVRVILEAAKGIVKNE